MPSNPFFSGRIPLPLFERVEEYRTNTNQTKTEILIRALAAYVEFELDSNIPQIPPIRQEFDEIYKRLQKIEDQVFCDF